jgi:hypothetical protein
MTKPVLTICALLALVVLIGCGRTKAAPRFEGRIVSHVDTYASGTGSESRLDREGSMSTGFNYGDPAKADWTSDIKWRFLRQDEGVDVYQIEWTFRPQSGAGVSQTKEVFFDGSHSVRVSANPWQTVSIEPGTMKQ